MSVFGIDYAWGGPPSDRALRQAHVAFVCRYLSPDPSKSLSKAEYEHLTRLGIAVHVVWESTAQRALEGFQAGRQDALLASAQAWLCGVPASEPIRFAIDFDATGPDVDEYFAGADTILRARTSAYGGYKPIKHLLDRALISNPWQTYAWSDGQWEPRARLRQYSNGHQLGGVDVDWNIELPDPHHPAYTPGDEHNWIREYDRLTRQHRAAPRRAFLRTQMRRRMALLRRLAKKSSWQILNRTIRYRELQRRAG